MFFVDGQYHRKGIGKKLWEAVLSNTSANLITVHSSLYAAEIYKKLGFYQTRNESFRPGCGSGYLTFPIAQRSEKAYVVGLDSVTDTLERNAVKAQEMDIKNLEFISYDGITFPFCLKLLCLMAETTIVCFPGEVG